MLKGQVLYWDEKASDQNICMMFESCGGKHADNEVWFITKNRNFDDYYGLYLYKTYNGNKDRCNRIEIDALTGRDQPYLISTKGPHVFCGPFSNQDEDTNNKLWELVPVNFVRGMSQAAPSATSKKKGKVQIKWDKLRKKIKSSEAWKKAKYIEIQYSTDKDFLKNVKTKRIKKGTINKKKAKSKLSKLKRKKTYYLRARLVDKKGVGSNWTKSLKIKTKK